ncbi:MAG: ferritin-like domain-containing protein [Acidobacteria bacterium]|nr:ferritin-like domain-containing protein [Acidobacteriota bacterium]
MTPAALLDLLQAVYRETLDLVQARQVNARSVTDYDANNAYQQVLGRQDVHLRWLADAIDSLGGAASSPGQSQDDALTTPHADVKTLVEADARTQADVIERWAPRVKAISNARHRKMLELILGEMAEHLRVFQQALEGRSDLLGRHSAGKVLRGEVMATRPRN